MVEVFFRISARAPDDLSTFHPMDRRTSADFINWRSLYSTASIRLPHGSRKIDDIAVYDLPTCLSDRLFHTCPVIDDKSEVPLVVWRLGLAFALFGKDPPTQAAGTRSQVQVALVWAISTPPISCSLFFGGHLSSGKARVNCISVNWKADREGQRAGARAMQRRIPIRFYKDQLSIQCTGTTWHSPG